jgi:hypothetical protein
MSGAALLASPSLHLLGLVTADPVRYGNDRLDAVSVDALVADQGFRRIVGVTAQQVAEVASGAELLRGPYLRLPPRYPEPWLLAPEYGVVPFVARDGRLAQLTQWCRGSEALSIAVVTGDGGSGKSRLAAELGHRMQAEGWDAGTVAGDPSHWEVFDPAWPTLAVFDYAERATAVLIPLLNRLILRPDHARTRILLISRSRGTWWEAVERGTNRFAGYLIEQVLELERGRLGRSDRREHAELAAAAFAEQLGRPAGPPPAVDSDEYSTPLLVHATALLAVHGEAIDAAPGRVRAALLRQLLDREERRWLRALHRHGLAELHEDTVRQAVALATLAAPTRPAAAALLASVPALADSGHLRDKVTRWLADLLPGGGSAIEPLRPDLVVEELLDRTPDLADLVTTAFLNEGRAGPGGGVDLDRVLHMLRMAAERRRRVAEALPDLPAMVFAAERERCLTHLRRQGWPELSEAEAMQLVTVAALTSPAEAEVDSLAATVPGLAVATPGRRRAAAAWLAGYLAARGVAAADLRSEILLEGLLEQVSDLPSLADNLCRTMSSEPLVNMPLLGRALDRLQVVASRRPGVRLALAGAVVANATDMIAAAVVRPVEELVRALERTLVVTGGESGVPDACRRVLDRLPPQSVALAGLSATVAGLALAAAADDPAVPDRSAEVARLSNLYARRLAEAGRDDEALTAAAQATGRYRQLAEADPDRYLAPLAGSIDELSSRLAALGHDTEALNAVREATQLHRKLAESDVVYLPGLASNLDNFGKRLAALQQHQKAVSATGEATSHYRRLAEQDPVTYLSDLARSLNNLAVGRSTIGRYEAALDASIEATAIYRELVTEQPDRYHRELATCLNNLSIALSAAGRNADASAATAEAAVIYRQLAATNPDRYLPDLATTLHNQGVDLSRAGHPAEALAALGEAIAIRRRLAEGNPDKHLPELAASLQHRSSVLLTADRLNEAADAVLESIALWRTAASRAPQYRASLNSVLQVGSRLLWRTERYDQAYAVEAELFEVQKLLGIRGGGG